MGIEAFSKSIMGRFLINVLAAGMESRFRYRFFSPESIISGAHIRLGQIVLEVGCGTGYFTIPLGRLIGDQGCLVSVDVLPESVEIVSERVRTAKLTNVRVLKRDATNTGLDAGSFDMVLLFGVIPAPMLPLSRLLPEIHRVLKGDGGLAVWPPISGWLPRSIIDSGLFTFSGKRNGVHNFMRC